MSERQASNALSDKEKSFFKERFSILDDVVPSTTRSYYDDKDFEATFRRLMSHRPTLHLERQAAIEKSALVDPTNIQQVAASQLAIVNSYYESGLHQSRQSFRWSLIWGGVGFIFLIIAVAVLILRQPGEGALVSGLAGAVVEGFAGTYLYLYKHASDQLAAFRSSLERTQYLLLANSICEGLGGECEQQMKVELIRRTLDFISAKPLEGGLRGEKP